MSEDVTKKRGRGDGEQQGFSLVPIEGDPGSRKQLKLAGECYGGVRDTGLRRVAGIHLLFSLQELRRCWGQLRLRQRASEQCSWRW